jgi:hypothetical protein
MEIRFYLNSTEVPKPYFKQFSSRSHIWLKLIDQYSNVLEHATGSLKLVYIPAKNCVEPEYDRSNSLLSLIHEEALQVSLKNVMYSRSYSQVLIS